MGRNLGKVLLLPPHTSSEPPRHLGCFCGFVLHRSDLLALLRDIEYFHTLCQRTNIYDLGLIECSFWSEMSAEVTSSAVDPALDWGCSRVQSLIVACR